MDNSEENAHSIGGSIPSVEFHKIEITPNASLDGLAAIDTLGIDRQKGSACPSMITLMEIAPVKNAIADRSEKSQTSSSICQKWKSVKCSFQRVSQEDSEGKKLPKNVRRYYKQQQEITEAFQNSNHEDEHLESADITEANDKAVALAVRLSLFCNVLLLIGKIVASYLSGSLSIISSLVDSAVDLVSGIIFWYTTRSIKTTNFYEYPSGKTRLEPVAVIILSVIMTVASIQLIVTSIQTIAESTANPDISISTIVIIAVTIVCKFCLFLYCRRLSASSTKALAQDHRNDVLSNSVALGMGYLGFRVWKNADPIGAIIISLYIAYGWWKTGAQQVRSITGHTARPELLQKLIWVCVTHDSRVQYIDTLRAFHFGNNLLVEAHIVLPPDMSLREAHDIGEALQQKLERFPNVERAFVHIDYEFEHHPSDEHKMTQKPKIEEVK